MPNHADDQVSSDDRRNVIDVFRGLSVDVIRDRLDQTRNELEIAVENLERDFNMGTIVRTANAFNVAKVHVIGRRQWNKRGAMKTDAYLHIEYHPSVDSFETVMRERDRVIVAVDIVAGAVPLAQVMLPRQAVLVFGSEGAGLSHELLSVADSVVMIEQFGSTRSVNVGVAAGIVMYRWMQQHKLNVER